MKYLGNDSRDNKNPNQKSREAMRPCHCLSKWTSMISGPAMVGCRRDGDSSLVDRVHWMLDGNRLQPPPWRVLTCHNTVLLGGISVVPLPEPAGQTSGKTQDAVSNTVGGRWRRDNSPPIRLAPSLFERRWGVRRRRLCALCRCGVLVVE